MLKTTVMTRGAAQHDMTGRFLGYPLRSSADCVSRGLADRLHRYALGRLDEAGFGKLVDGWEAEVFTADGDEQPSDRSYSVKFANAKGGYIEVVGILTSRGWPSLDHGFDIGQE